MDGTEEDLQAFEKTLIRLSKEIPLTVEELSKIGELGGQLGVPLENLQKFVDTVARIGVSTNLSTEEAAT